MPADFAPSVAGLPLTTLAYCRSLPHLGEARDPGASGMPLMIREIPGTGLRDAVGPWPYGGAPTAQAFAGLLARLREEGLVSLTLFIRPDEDEAALAALRRWAEVRPLKEHFVLDPLLPRPAPGPRTRRNLARAGRCCRIEALPAHRLAALGPVFQAALRARRVLSGYADVPPEHFAALAGMEGVAVMAAVDAEGPAALLVALRAAGETHLLHLLSLPRAVPSCATYLLVETALRDWSRDGRVYLGGAPSSADGPGIARFKSRWSNRTAPVHLLGAILDPAAYASLARGRSPGSFFPAYRDMRR
ncbi:hypothetical protein [Roseomonas sp. USHLN139]|uniref:hypothetical protein n=1 Tax=Roseomonas sp. USHLN139 TaxID=3081298 RepID=UPI003B02917F